MNKKLLLLALIPLIASCGGTKTSDDQSIQGQSESETYTEVTLEELTTKASAASSGYLDLVDDGQIYSSVAVYGTYKDVSHDLEINVTFAYQEDDTFSGWNPISGTDDEQEIALSYCFYEVTEFTVGLEFLTLTTDNLVYAISDKGGFRISGDYAGSMMGMDFNASTDLKFNEYGHLTNLKNKGTNYMNNSEQAITTEIELTVTYVLK